MELMKYKIKKDYKYLYKFLNFDYEVYLSALGSEIEKRYNELKIEGEEEGFIPLILHPSKILDEMLQLLIFDLEIEPTNEGINEWRKDTISLANSLDPDEILTDRMQDIINMAQDEYDYYDLNEGDLIDVPSSDYISGFTVEYQEIIICKIPTKYIWELPIWIPMGGFNNCPTPEEQASVFKKWNKEYGANPICLSYESWELYLDEPIKDDSTCYLVAEEQMAFCEEIVLQSELETLTTLASHIKNSKVWYFWWE